MARPGPSASFSAFASRLLSNPLSPPSPDESRAPLFYSTADGEIGLTRSDDIFGREESVEPWESSHYRSGRPQSEQSDSDVLGSIMQAQDKFDPFLGHDDRLGDQDPFVRDESLPDQSQRRDSLGGSTGWKIHQTTTFQPDDAYRDPTELSETSSRFVSAHERPSIPHSQPSHQSPSYPPFSDADQSSTSSRPPSPVREPRFPYTFFRSSQAPTSLPGEIPQTLPTGPSQPTTTTAPHILYPRPSTTLGRGAPHHRRDPKWLVFYELCVLSTVGVALWTAFEPPPLPTTFVQALPLLTFLSFVALLVGMSASAYVFVFKEGVRQFVYASLAMPPVVFVLAAGWAFSASWGLEPVATAKALRWSCVISLVIAAFLSRSAWKRRGQIDRTVNALEVRLSMTFFPSPPIHSFTFCLLCLARVQRCDFTSRARRVLLCL
jgi:hypothetical protein